MFETLVESGHRRRAPARAGVAAFALHVGIVALAVQRTAGSTVPVLVRDTVAIPIYQAPPTPAPSTGTVGEEPGIPVPVAIPVADPGPITIDPVNIDPHMPISGGGDLRDSILTAARSVGFSPGSRGGTTGPIDGILLAGEVDEPVHALTTITPKYPRALEVAGVAGRVVLQFVVDTLGSVEPLSIRAMEATDSAFAGPSRDAILATRYAPARARGRVVRQLVRQTLLFRTAR